MDNDSVTEINDLPEATRREKLPSARSDASKPEASNKEEKVQKGEESADSLERAFAKLELELA